MPGRGPAPKDPDTRARRNADPTPQTELEFKRARPPRLPKLLADDDMVSEWWATWTTAPQAAYFTATDWQVLLETAFLLADFYAGDRKVAGEIRLRVAKFGATPEDRQRLRMHFTAAEAPAPPAKKTRKPTTARDRYKGLTVMPGGRST